VFDGVTLEGFLDLLVETPEGYTVVDFKSDTARPEDAIQRYRLQGASYALCVETMLGKPVTQCVLVFVQSGAEVDIPDLPSAIAEAAATCIHSLPGQRNGLPC